MGTHTTICLQLYDFLHNELDDRHRTEVEEHLRVCAECRAELEHVRATIEVLPRPTDNPADELPPEFWQSFMADVEETISQQERPAPAFWSRFVEQFTSLPLFQPRVAIAMAVVFVMILGGVVTREVLRSRPPTPLDETVLHAARIDTVPAIDVNTRMSGYLRRSKNLLVGLANMNPAHAGDGDFSTERRASRDLVQEARFLKQLPLDDRSVRLLSDLEKIQIELANLEGTQNRSEVELIRHGIQRENLLFKVRVTETLYDRASFVRTGYEK
jgi:hypothetical protein